MALKLDMECVYNIMRWEFLEAVIKTANFAGKFVDLVMGCSYRIWY